MNSKMGALICLLGLSLMGCGEASPQPAENERGALESVEITEEEPQNEPGELLVSVDNPAYFEDAVENFEREYPQYRIILLTPEDGEDSAQFHTRIRAEIESGQGPDILDDGFINGYIIDALAYAEAGYIQPWGEIFTAAEQEQLLPGVLDTGRIKDELYGIPYKCGRRTLVTSKSRIGDAEKPDLNQLMRLVEESGAERLASRLPSSSIFELCVLSDKEDNTFIAGDNRTRDFTGDDFLNVLLFARTYVDK
ncbi:MAG: extracellular solute-binding protein [Acetatifactor sp.]|nr:extracellular solute-binding protein [Acetatifactor sp.]